MQIDESQLPEGWDQGVIVERGSDGAICRVAVERGPESAELLIDDQRFLVRETHETRWDTLVQPSGAPDDRAVVQELVVEALQRMILRTGRLACSFCGKSQDEVRKLVAGPNVFICDECVDLCSEIVDDDVDVEVAEEAES